VEELMLVWKYDGASTALYENLVRVIAPLQYDNLSRVAKDMGAERVTEIELLVAHKFFNQKNTRR
jgi:diacylglycerol kinase